ncbi:glycosyltransferase family 2 protein [Aurantiacibacter arachoides]|uniref:glycosyltransferase family 2 protein n=1 Tax=Aurantiacibacter arachoides TaxID=1850444 RepID=UPI0018F8BD64|nr:glycosyltransferase [Aurantiacibacter arachoides]GGD64037.1 glycosyl transferase family A [Aurantiacibacter arachoides]
MVAYRPVSVLTLVRGRQAHLDHLVAGLLCQTTQPDELVIAYMQDEPPHLPAALPFAVRLIQVAGEPMPLALARNRAAAAATGEVLAFLDVDCIPDPEFVRRGREATGEFPHGVFLPEVRYLPANSGGWTTADGAEPDYAHLRHESIRHPSKPDLAGCTVAPIDDFGELWGLAFVLTADCWQAAGGMDEGYCGYGAEETDFGRRLEAAGARLFWLGGTVCFHQHHHVHKPPLQHFESIVRNARLFHDRWGTWCMDYWLDDLARRGLIARNEDGLSVLRHPLPAEIAATRQGPDVLFS